MREKYSPDAVRISIKQTGAANTITWSDTVRTLLQALVPDDTENTEDRVKTRLECELMPEKLEATDFARQRKAIMSLNNGKVPGLDNIEVEVLNRCALTILDEFTILFNGCLEWGKVPRN